MINTRSKKEKENENNKKNKIKINPKTYYKILIQHEANYTIAYDVCQTFFGITYFNE